MCTCASCLETDRRSGLPDLLGEDETRISGTVGFENWPRGNPAGHRVSASDYAAHVAHSRFGAIKGDNGQPFRLPGLVYPVKQVSKSVLDWINRKTEKLVAQEFPPEPPARPAQACKPEQHFPVADRRTEADKIYAMPKKRPVGRPAIPGRRVVIKLNEAQIRRADKLGAGNVAAGIRKALASTA